MRKEQIKRTFVHTIRKLIVKKLDYYFFLQFD